MRTLLAAITLAISMSSAWGQVNRMEVLTVQSIDLSDSQFLRGQRDGRPVTLGGTLRLPKGGSDRLPTVVLLHGSGGISGYITEWEQEFNAMGLATFVVDSWTGRGLTTTVFDQSLAGRLAQLFDAYRVFEALERHPRVDPDRIVVMGFSRGAASALLSGVKRFQRMHGPASGREFAGIVALYPTCNTAYREYETVTARPIRIFHGAADDYVPIGWCRDYARRLKTAGADIQHTEYPGANHVFDWPALKTPLKLDKAQMIFNCRLEEAQDGRIVDVSTKAPFTFKDSCIHYGVTIGYDENANLDARKSVKAFLSTVLKP